MNSSKVDLKDKMIYAHKGYFNRASYDTYRENSVEVFKMADSKPYIQAIELDVRKSKDGVLYCYHGNLFQYLFILKLHLPFAELKKRYGAPTLTEVLDVISPGKVLILDMKDTKVTKEDIASVFAGKQFREIVIANKSVSFLKRFNDMPKEFVKMLNGNIFSTFYNFPKLREDNFKYFEIVFPFMATKKTLARIKENGLEFVGFPAAIFLGEKQYLRCVNKYNLPYIPAYFVTDK